MQAQFCWHARWVTEEVEEAEEEGEEEEGEELKLLEDGDDVLEEELVQSSASAEQNARSGMQDPIGMRGKNPVKAQVPRPEHSAGSQRLNKPFPHSPQRRQESCRHSSLEEEELAEEPMLEEEVPGEELLLPCDVLLVQDELSEDRPDDCPEDVGELEEKGQHAQPPATPRPCPTQHA